MGEFGIRMQRFQGRHGLVSSIVHEDRVTLDVAITRGLGGQVDVEILDGIPLQDDRETILALLLSPTRSISFFDSAT